MRKLLLSLLLVFSASFFPGPSSATTEYARQTGFQCKECHVEAIGGGKLTNMGEKFLEDLKIKGLYRPLSETQKIVFSVKIGSNLKNTLYKR